MSTFHVKAKISADGSGFASEIDKAFGGLKSKIAGMFSAAAIIESLRSIRQFVSEIKETSDQVGLTYEALQELNFAFIQNGASAEDMAGAVRNLAKIREDALDGDKKAVALMEKYGIGVLKLKAMGTDDLFMAMAKSIREIPDPMSRAAAATELLGKSGMKLIPSLEGLEAARRAAREGGNIISDGDIKSIDEASSALDRLTLKSKVLAAQKLLGLVGKGLSSKDSIAAEKYGGVGGTLRGWANLPQTYGVAGIAQLGIKKMFSKLDEIMGVNAAATAIELGKDASQKKRKEFLDAMGMSDKAMSMIMPWLKPVHFAKGEKEISGKSFSSRGVDLTDLQRIGAYAPGSQQNQTIPLLQKQVQIQGQLLDQVRTAFGVFGVKL